MSQYVPTRPAIKKVAGGAERALAGFHRQTATITSTLLEEYRQLFGGREGGEEEQLTMDDR